MRLYAKTKLVAGLLLVSARGFASGQAGFNIDLDDLFGDPGTGGGLPSAQFSAATGQFGNWTRVPNTGPWQPVTLYGLDGLATNCQLVTTGGATTGGGYNNPGMSGDYRLLMADFGWVGSPIQYHFSGFAP